MPPRTVDAIIVGSPGITSVSAPNPGRISKVKAQETTREIKGQIELHLHDEHTGRSRGAHGYILYPRLFS
jgi:hypothetical protein